ncbi:MAG: ribonuclease P protein component [Thermodesulfobacteriota bacterium]
MEKRPLPKTVCIAKPWEYREIYARGRRLRGDHFTLVWRKSGHNEARLGISIHGVRQAVRRNRIKRIIREFFRLHRQLIDPPVDLVFAVRDGFVPDSPAAVAAAVRQVLDRQPAKAFGFMEPQPAVARRNRKGSA